MQNQNVRLAIAFIIGLLVGIGGYWIYDNRGGYPEEEIIDNAMLSDVLEGDNALAVDNQAPGNTVVIKGVLLKNPGWVAIHDDVNGQPGKILGATLFDKGQADGTVELLRNTVEGASYIAVLHNDDGDYKNFNPKTDLPLNADNGTMVMVKFTTSNTQPAASSIELDSMFGN